MYLNKLRDPDRRKRAKDPDNPKYLPTEVKLTVGMQLGTLLFLLSAGSDIWH